MTLIETLHFNYRLLIQELQQRGVFCRLIPGTEIVECSYRGQKEYLLETSHRLIPAHYNCLVNDKIYAKSLLRDAKLPTVPFIVLHTRDIEEAIHQVEKELSYPICIKPPHLTHGYFVHPFIEHQEDFRSVWEQSLAPQKFPALLVEKHLPGEDIRVFLMKGEDPVVLRRSPPTVLGNGRDSLRVLIEKENERRMNPRTNCLCDIYLKDPDGVRCLEKQGLSLDSIPKQGERVSLLFVSNVSYGGTCENITGKVHNDYLNLADRVFALFEGLPYLAVDLLLEDFTAPLNQAGGYILELGTNPGFSLFSMPSEGPPVNIVSRVADRLFPQTRKVL